MTRAKGKRHAVTLNVWGTPRHLINADEFCPDCEQFVPRHYNNCPTRKR